MEEQILIPQLANVVLKVKQQQELTAEEELLYLIHIEGLPTEEAQALIKEWFQSSDFRL